MSDKPKPTEEQARTAVGHLGSTLSLMLDKHQLPRVVPHLDTLRAYFAPDEAPTPAKPPTTAKPKNDDSSSIGGRPSPPAPR